MINYIFTGIFVLSFITAIINGSTENLSRGILEGATNAVNISLKLLGSMALWNGLSEIMTQSGLIKIPEKFLSPFIQTVFPKSSKTSAKSAIAASVTANLLGIGNAATPLGIEAMKKIHDGTNTANNEAVRFVVLNSAAVTLIPTSAVTLRIAAGSRDPFSVLIPVWITGFITLAVGLLTEKILSKRWKV